MRMIRNANACKMGIRYSMSIMIEVSRVCVYRVNVSIARQGPSFIPLEKQMFSMEARVRDDDDAVDQPRISGKR